MVTIETMKKFRYGKKNNVKDENSSRFDYKRIFHDIIGFY